MLMTQATIIKNQKYLNKIVSVLVENKTSKYWFGHSSEQKVVKFPITEKDYIGQIVDVKIEKAEEWNLYGQKI